MVIPDSGLFFILKKRSKHDDYDARGEVVHVFDLDERVQSKGLFFLWSSSFLCVRSESMSQTKEF